MCDPSMRVVMSFAHHHPFFMEVFDVLLVVSEVLIVFSGPDDGLEGVVLLLG